MPHRSEGLLSSRSVITMSCRQQGHFGVKILLQAEVHKKRSAGSALRSLTAREDARQPADAQDTCSCMQPQAGQLETCSAHAHHALCRAKERRPEIQDTFMRRRVSSMPVQHVLEWMKHEARHFSAGLAWPQQYEPCAVQCQGAAAGDSGHLHARQGGQHACAARPE